MDFGFISGSHSLECGIPDTKQWINLKKRSGSRPDTKKAPVSVFRLGRVSRFQRPHQILHETSCGAASALCALESFHAAEQCGPHFTHF
jgi:hypothetical protein